MSDELSIDDLGEEELNSAKKVIDTDRKDRTGETIQEAFVNRIAETVELGNTGYKREVVFPIPLSLIQENSEVKDFLKKVGKVSRTKSYGLSIVMEETIEDEVELMNLIFEPTQKTEVDKIRSVFKV